MRTLNRIVLSLVVYLMNASRISVGARLLVQHDSVVVPTLLPKLVDDIHIFISAIVSLVVRYVVAHAILQTSTQIAGDNIPACATVGKMVKRAEQARGVIWR